MPDAFVHFVSSRLEFKPVVGWLFEEMLGELQQLRQFNHGIPLTVISIFGLPAPAVLD